jgi:hypothetical protein
MITPPSCAPEDIAVSIEVRKPDWKQNEYPEDFLTPEWKRGRVATVVARNVASRPVLWQ